jgi:methionine-rich copper-binding protein CopC
MRPRAVLFTLALAASVTTAALAVLHARLVRAEPGIDGTVTSAPTAVRLWFNEPVSPRLTTAILLTADSIPVDTVAFAATDERASVVGPVTATLRPGSYRVQWRTVSQDGHPIRGEYRFQYRAP